MCLPIGGGAMGKRRKLKLKPDEKDEEINDKEIDILPIYNTTRRMYKETTQSGPLLLQTDCQ
jgi:hypothetical protein